MKDMIQRMTDLEAKKQLKESNQLEECPPDMPEQSMPMDQGNPVSVNISMNASGKEHVEDLLKLMKQAGLDDAKTVSTDMMPMRQDMERLRDIVDEPDPEDEMEPNMDGMSEPEDEDPKEDYNNEPDEEYRDHEFMTKDLSGGLNREKKAYKAAQDGDNAMAVESIKDQLYAALSEKKAKPDYLDMDGDGDKKEPMKKAVKDKESKKKMTK